MTSGYDLASRFTPEEGLRFEQATLALAGAAMRGNSMPVEQAETPAMKEMLIYQIKRQNFGSADQSPEQIASHFGISVGIARRHLYQLLEPIGGIARYQRHLRLQLCLSDLQNPELNHLRISEIAYRWGFSNPATFNRNFRSAFGLKPRDARNRDLQGTHAQKPSSPHVRREEDAQAEHRLWFQALEI